MNCEQFRNMVYDLAEGELAPEVRNEAELHMKSCPDCRKEYEECVKLTDTLRSMGEVKAPEDLLPNVMREISVSKKRIAPKIIRFGTAAAAAVLLIAGVVTVAPTLYRDADVTDIEPEPLETEITADATTEVQTDGSSLEDSAEAEKSTISASSASEGGIAEAVSGAAADSVPVVDDAAENAKEKKAPPIQAKKSAAPETEEKQAAQETSGGAFADESIQTETTEAVSDEVAFADSAAVLPETEITAEQIPENVTARSGATAYGGGGVKSSGGGGLGETADTGIAAYSADETTDDPEVRYVSRTIEFRIKSAYAESAALVETEGRTTAQVEEQLKSLEIPYTIAIIDEDYTDEYKIASAERQAEIEQLCIGDRCEITYEEG